MSKLLDSAFTYQEKHNFCVIPVGKDKKPLIKWESYQKEKATLEEIKQWWTKWPDANIGIVTGGISNLAVIDIDTEEGKEAIQEYVPDSLLIPTCQTPKGEHLYFQCPDPPLSNNSRIIPGCDLRCEGGYIIVPPSKNNEGKEYKWIVSMDNTPLPPLPKAYIDYVLSKASNANSLNNIFSLYKGCRQNVDTNPLLFTEGYRDNTLFHVANCLVKGGMPVNEIAQLLEMIAKNCIPPYPEKDLKAKIESALKRAERHERNLSQEVREWVLSTNGVFLSTDVHRCLQVSTRKDMKNVSIILRRFCDEGLIEKYGNRSGCFRVIDASVEEIDYMNAPTESLDIKWPLGEERYLMTLPGNIMIVAGVSNAGKTAYLLNFIELNMHKFNFFYFNSEMGATELRNRLSKFGRPLNSWKFKAVERSSNFADVIKPNDINVIDYLEVHDDFWKVGGMIKDIHDRLDKGIAVIAIQKDPHKEYGIGATRSIEKARLYLIMDSNLIKIVKAKNWMHETMNPNGLELHFKLVQGCKFIVERDWRKEK